MTLLETLAVLVLLASVATATIGVLPSMGAATQHQAAVLELRASIERARMLASRGSGAGYRVSAESTESGGPDDALIAPSMPTGWSARLLDSESGEEISVLRFDSLGRCQDVRLELSRTGEDEPTVVFSVLGLTGQVVDLEGQSDRGGGP